MRTSLDTICGMRVSNDGKYVVLAGQQGGGIEVYSIGGERGDERALVAGLDEGFDGGIKHVIWL